MIPLIRGTSNMTQTNLSMKQNQRHKDQTGGCQVGGGWERGGVGGRDQQMPAYIYMYRMNKQQGPTVEHRELYPISCDKS